MSQPSPSLGPGALLAGRYVLGDELGRGGMGVVHAAHDQRSGAGVAVKLVGVLGMPADRARAVREAESLERLSHPHIVRVLDRGSLGPVLFLVMERLRGRDLAERIAEAGSLPLAEVVQVGGAVARALAHAHAAGVVHRDVKPSNVFLARLDGHEQVKVVDFGIAKLLDEAALTRSRQMVGTLRYMAPEQIESSRHVREPADVYGLGVVLYQMLAGRLPFIGSSYAELVQATRFDRPPPVGSLRRGLPAVLGAAIDACLAKRPASRPSLAEVRVALEGVECSPAPGSPSMGAAVLRSGVATLPPPRPVGGPALDDTLPAETEPER